MHDWQAQCSTILEDVGSMHNVDFEDAEDQPYSLILLSSDRMISTIRRKSTLVLPTVLFAALSDFISSPAFLTIARFRLMNSVQPRRSLAATGNIESVGPDLCPMESGAPFHSEILQPVLDAVALLSP
jgi:hypothetical protein